MESQETVVGTEKAKSTRARRAEPVPVKIEDVLQLLEAGKERHEISKILGLNFSETNALFQHPELKGKKTKKNLFKSFTIVDADKYGEIPQEVQEAFMSSGKGNKDEIEEEDDATPASTEASTEVAAPSQVAIAEDADATNKW